MLFLQNISCDSGRLCRADGYSESEGRQWLAAFLCTGQFVYANMENGC